MRNSATASGAIRTMERNLGQVLGSVLTLVVSAVGCTSNAEPEELAEVSVAIHNGFVASSTQYPEVVYVSTGSSYCTGTLIDPTTVLTAAHCFDDEPAAASVSVGFGTNINDLQYVSAIGYEVHPDYDLDYLFGAIVSSHHDTALVHLSTWMSSPIAKLVSPAEDSAWVTEGAIVRIVGFGANDLGSPVTSQQIKLGGISYVRNVKQWVTRLDALPSSACFGDSGGPFFITGNGVSKQAGVLSFGSNSCDTWNKYARVILDLKWIHEKTSLPCDSGLPCTQRCFDFKCDAASENPYTCYHDCAGAACGDGNCTPGYQETEENCPSDCFCGDGMCDNAEKASGSCPGDCTTTGAGDGYSGDGNCSIGENWATDPQDCPPP